MGAGSSLNAGDGFYASFDGPARAIRCAQDIAASIRPLGIEIRTGLHTGECEIVDGKSTGLAVSIGARVMSLADAGESVVVIDNLSTGFTAFLPEGVPLFIGDAGDENLVAGVPRPRLGERRLDCQQVDGVPIGLAPFEEGVALEVAGEREKGEWHGV